MIRSILAVVALSLAVPATALAQSAPAAPPVTAPAPPVTAPAPPAPGAVPAHHHNRYMAALHSLTLTPAQQTQIAGFISDTKTANQGADRPTKRDNMKKLRDQIDGVLTPDQRAQLQAKLVQQRTNSAN